MWSCSISILSQLLFSTQFNTMRYYSSKKNKLRWQHLLAILVIILFYSKDKYYFFNGLGAKNWNIGSPQANITNSLQTRNLEEASHFALKLVNRDREVNGLPPLLLNPLISKTAQLHAEDMAKRNYFNHRSPEGLSPSDRYINLGGLGGVGENISVKKDYPARFTFGVVEVFQRGLMYSDGHRNNILNPKYTKFGYGIAVDSTQQKIYAVQNFQ